jgi:hypothetical protein
MRFVGLSIDLLPAVSLYAVGWHDDGTDLLWIWAFWNQMVDNVTVFFFRIQNTNL